MNCSGKLQHAACCAVMEMPEISMAVSRHWWRDALVLLAGGSSSWLMMGFPFFVVGLWEGYSTLSRAVVLKSSFPSSWAPGGIHWPSNSASASSGATLCDCACFLSTLWASVTVSYFWACFLKISIRWSTAVRDSPILGVMASDAVPVGCVRYLCLKNIVFPTRMLWVSFNQTSWHW